jgi:DNA topoisomerase-1
VALPLTNPVVSARNAGLRYVSDQAPGIRRIGTGKTFRYIGTQGRALHDRETLSRIRSLAIPPAWTDVWICPHADGHLQAVGRDARKRKQYRYHARWREVRDETKFDRMAAFGKVLPKIRRRVKRDLAKSGFNREKVLATIVRLLETTLIRVGNEEYTRHNNSFGLTTLRNRHVDISGAKVHFYFRGKSGVKHAISIEDNHLARIVRHLRELPGYELFQYIDDDGNKRSIGSTDVNDYLREITGEEFTSKDFRTWAATVLALEALCKCPSFTSQRQAKKNVVKVVEKVAQRLGNTAAVCKKCYIHPSVFDAYMAGTALSPGEKALQTFLKKWTRRKPKLSLEQALVKSVRQTTRRKKQ